MVPFKCAYDKLVEIICEEIGIDRLINTIAMKYRLEDAGAFVKITSDKTLAHYLNHKVAEIGIGKYPIFIESMPTIRNEIANSIAPSGPGTVIYPSLEDVVTNTSGYNSTSLIPTLPTLEEMGKEICDIPSVQAEDDNDDIHGIVTEIDSRKIEVGTVFKNKELLTLSVCMQAISEPYQFVTEKSDGIEYRVKCVDGKCNWRLRASRIKNTEMFKIRRVEVCHQCSLETLTGNHRNATSYLVAHCVKYKFIRTTTIYSPSDIQHDMLTIYGIRISYNKAWRAREQALEMIRGDPVESYQNLPSYLRMLKVTNPGSKISKKTDNEDRFLYCYVALGAFINGWRHRRPIMVVDATYLKGNYGGALFTPCTQDANGNIFILAFGVGDNENDNSWGWFLQQVKESYGERDGLCIVSDQHRSIENVAQLIFPSAENVACSFHLLKNIRTTFGKRAKGVREPFNATVKAYTIPEFETHMARIDEIDEEIRPYLIAVGYEKWSRAHSKVNRYSTMTSNIVESVNAATNAAKNFPIEALFESLRGLIQNWFNTNSDDAHFTFRTMCKKQEMILQKRLRNSMRLQVIRASPTVYQVNDGAISYVVKLEERSCTCRCSRFDIDEIPYTHAMAAININNLSAYDYCPPYFSIQKYRDAYRSVVNPLGIKIIG